MDDQPTQDTFFHQVVHSAARISVEQPNGMSTVGTGFFFRTTVSLSGGQTHSNLLLISNKHVLANGHTGRVVLRLNRIQADGTPDYGNTYRYCLTNFSARYTSHPDEGVDLACVPIEDIIPHSFIKSLTSEFLTDIDYTMIAPGSDVWFVGYPHDYYDKVNNLPLVRKGTLASLPTIDFGGKGHLVVDAQVFPGSSGSPVFVDSGGTARLIGVLESAVQTAEAGGVVLPIGLGIVIKQNHVRELIYHTNEKIKQVLDNIRPG